MSDHLNYQFGYALGWINPVTLVPPPPGSGTSLGDGAYGNVTVGELLGQIAHLREVLKDFMNNEERLKRSLANVQNHLAQFELDFNGVVNGPLMKKVVGAYIKVFQVLTQAPAPVNVDQILEYRDGESEVERLNRILSALVQFNIDERLEMRNVTVVDGGENWEADPTTLLTGSETVSFLQPEENTNEEETEKLEEYGESKTKESGMEKSEESMTKMEETMASEGESDQVHFEESTASDTEEGATGDVESEVESQENYLEETAQTEIMKLGESSTKMEETKTNDEMDVSNLEEFPKPTHPFENSGQEEVLNLQESIIPAPPPVPPTHKYYLRKHRNTSWRHMSRACAPFKRGKSDNFLCYVCSRQFASKWNLNRHLVSCHNEKVVSSSHPRTKALECHLPEDLTLKRTSSRSLKSSTASKEPVQFKGTSRTDCLCGRKFDRSVLRLLEHSKIYHSLSEGGTTKVVEHGVDTEKSSGGQLACVCGWGGESWDNLMSHLRTHTTQEALHKAYQHGMTFEGEMKNGGEKEEGVSRKETKDIRREVDDRANSDGHQTPKTNLRFNLEICWTCGKIFGNHAAVMRHRYNEHSTDDNQSSRTFSNRSVRQARGHGVASRDGSNFVCFCGSRFSGRQNLAGHIRRFAASFRCDTSFMSSDAFQRHRDIVHKSTEGGGSSGYSSDNGITTPKRTAEAKGKFTTFVICPVCRVYFTSESAQRKHRLNAHPNSQSEANGQSPPARPTKLNAYYDEDGDDEVMCTSTSKEIC